MLSFHEVVKPSAERLAEAVDEVVRAEGETVDALNTGRVEQEPAFTDRLLGAIETRMEGFAVNGLKWHAKTLTDRGPGSQEKVYGADFVGVLDIDVPGFKITKGFLAQAKRIGASDSIGSDDWDDMVDQCKKMLALSPVSFVFLYSSEGVYIVPAHSVVASDRRNPHELYRRTIGTFFMHHFESFIGDTRVAKPHVSALESLAAEAEARRGLMLSLTDGEVVASAKPARRSRRRR